MTEFHHFEVPNFLTIIVLQFAKENVVIIVMRKSKTIKTFIVIIDEISML